jgi:hypothetical protein
LPHGIQTQTARHDGIAGEVAVEEPEIRRDIEFSQDFTLAVLAAMSLILTMRSIISMLGAGSWLLPSPNNSPRLQASSSSRVNDSLPCSHRGEAGISGVVI